MGRVSIHLAVILTVVALVSVPHRPAAPETSPSLDTARGPVVFKGAPPPGVRRTIYPTSVMAVARPAEKERAKTSPTPTTPPQAYPVPTGVNKSVLQAPGLSIRGLRLGMTQSQTRALYPGPEVVDRIKSYWGAGYQKETRYRFGATWYQYNGFFASYDRHQMCGAVTGDGLERQGVPILAKGDSGADVERLLGKPMGYAPDSYARDGTHWGYEFADHSYLVVQFSSGLVERFEWQQDGFSDSGC